MLVAVDGLVCVREKQQEEKKDRPRGDEIAYGENTESWHRNQ